jgi:hypothetical protein
MVFDGVDEGLGHLQVVDRIIGTEGEPPCIGGILPISLHGGKISRVLAVDGSRLNEMAKEQMMRPLMGSCALSNFG